MHVPKTLHQHIIRKRALHIYQKSPVYVYTKRALYILHFVHLTDMPCTCMFQKPCIYTHKALYIYTPNEPSYLTFFLRFKPKAHEPKVSKRALCIYYKREWSKPALCIHLSLSIHISLPLFRDICVYICIFHISIFAPFHISPPLFRDIWCYVSTSHVPISLPFHIPIFLPFHPSPPSFRDIWDCSCTFRTSISLSFHISLPLFRDVCCYISTLHIWGGYD